MKIKIAEVRCPKCGAEEMHPSMPDSCLIRGFKVFDEGAWWSQCLVCSGYYNEKLEITPDNHDSSKGWFC